MNNKVPTQSIAFKATPIIEQNRAEYLNYNEGSKIITNSTYFEGALNYSKTFKQRHEITAMLIGIMRELKYANAGNLQESLPYRNLGLSGRFTYAYDDRYFKSSDR